MLTELRSYYVANGIAAEAFRCPCEQSCRGVSKDFVSAREAFVGSEYERGTLPRVLFVSLDASSQHPGRAPSQRTLDHMRRCEEHGGCNVDSLPKNRHWYRTHEFAFRILEATAKARSVSAFRLDEVHRYFAHTNSAKCKDAARETSQGLPLLFDNCRRFIPPEVELLRPDAVVTQGNWAHLAIDGSFAVQRKVVWPAHPRYVCEILRIGGRPTLRFRMPHPRAFGAFNRQRREAYSWYSAVATAFFDGGVDAVDAES